MQLQVTATEFWLAVAAMGLICGGLSSFVAKSKYRDPGNWFAIGLLFGIFGLIAASGVAAQDRSVLFEACPECGKDIRQGAWTCKHCDAVLKKVEDQAE